MNYKNLIFDITMKKCKRQLEPDTVYHIYYTGDKFIYLHTYKPLDHLYIGSIIISKRFEYLPFRERYRQILKDILASDRSNLAKGVII